MLTTGCIEVNFIAMLMLSELHRQNYIDKMNFEANYYIGCICFDKNQIELALKSLKRALKADKNNIKCNEKLVEVYDELGFDELADKHRAMLKKIRAKK